VSYNINSTSIIGVSRAPAIEISSEIQPDRIAAPAGGYLSEMAVPIRMGAHVLGVFDIQSTGRTPSPDDDMTLIQRWPTPWDCAA